MVGGQPMHGLRKALVVRAGSPQKGARSNRGAGATRAWLHSPGWKLKGGEGRDRRCPAAPGGSGQERG